MSQNRADRIRDNFLRQGGRPERRHLPEPRTVHESISGPGRKADERIISIPVDELLPDRYQGRLRWPIELSDLERLYTGEWDAQDLLTHVARQRAAPSPALDDAWNGILDLARSILSEGQVAPITVSPSRELPVGYRFTIETGEGRYWAYQMMRWLLDNDPGALEVPQEEWREDPAFIRAVAIAEPSRLRQVAENEQRQSYQSAVDRAIAYASMLAEEAGYEVSGAPPGIREGILELPDAYWRAARRGLRGRQAVVQQVPTGRRQILRHLKLLTDLEPWVLAQAKQNGLTEAQLRPLIGKSPDEQRAMVREIIEQGLSSRAAALLEQRQQQDDLPMEATVSGDDEPASRGGAGAQPLTLPEEVARFIRSLTRAAGRYDRLREELSDKQLLALIEAELRSYDDAARGARRTRTPRRQIYRLLSLLNQIEEQ